MTVWPLVPVAGAPGDAYPAISRDCCHVLLTRKMFRTVHVQSCSFLWFCENRKFILMAQVVHMTLASSSLLSWLCLPEVKTYWDFLWDKFYSVPNNFMSLSLADIRCGWEPDGAWWVHHRGEADWDVVEAPGCRWRSWSCFKDLHCAPGQTKSHDAGKPTNSLNKSHFKPQSFS